MTRERSTGPSILARPVFLKAVLWALILWWPVSALTESLYRDSDIWFHLRTGQWIAEHGTVPRTDPFSSYGEGRPLTAYSWLYELGLYQLQHFVGLTSALLMYRFALVLGILAVWYRAVLRRGVPVGSAFALMGTALVTVLPLLYERPWLVSILFFGVIWEIVTAFKEGETKALWFLPVLFALWANIHIQFVYGLALLGAALVSVPIDHFFYPDEGPIDWRRVKQLTLVSLACIAATGINPYFFGLYETVWEYGQQKALIDLGALTEFTAPLFRSLSDWALLGLVIATAFALGRGRRLSSFKTLCFGFTCFLAFRSVRDVWTVVVVAVLILAESLGKWRPAPRPILIRWGSEIACAGLALTAVFLYWGNEREVFTRGLTVADTFPVRALDFLEKRNDTGIIFNPFSFGGYVMWRLPKMKVSIDGRTNVHGVERTLRYKQLMSTGVGWEHEPDLSRAHLVLWPKRAPLSAQLESSQDFKRIYEDGNYAVFERIPVRF